MKAERKSMEPVGDVRKRCQESISREGNTRIERVLPELTHMIIRRKPGSVRIRKWELNYVEALETPGNNYSRMSKREREKEKENEREREAGLERVSVRLYFPLMVISDLISIWSVGSLLIVFILYDIYYFIDFPFEFYRLKYVISLVYHGHTKHYSYLPRSSTCPL